MACGKCGKGTRLCPFSLGLALGLTSAIALFIWSVFVMYYAVPAPGQTLPAMTWGDIGMHTLYAFIKGFLFGFVLALIYDLIACACSCRKCKGKAGCSCSCGCCSSANCSCPCTCCAGKKNNVPPQQPGV